VGGLHTAAPPNENIQREDLNARGLPELRLLVPSAHGPELSWGGVPHPGGAKGGM